MSTHTNEAKKKLLRAFNQVSTSWKRKEKKRKKKHLYASSPNHFLKLFSEMANSVDARIVRLVSKWIVNGL